MVYLDVFMASAQMTVCEYKTRVFRGRAKVPVGVSNAHKDGDLRCSVRLREAQLCGTWKHRGFFEFFQRVSVLNDFFVGRQPTFHHQSTVPWSQGCNNKIPPVHLSLIAQTLRVEFGLIRPKQRFHWSLVFGQY